MTDPAVIDRAKAMYNAGLPPGGTPWDNLIPAQQQAWIARAQSQAFTSATGIAG